MNPDDYIMGTFDPTNPINMDEQIEVFESDNISECLDYQKYCGDYEPLENAIAHQETVIEKAISEIKFCIDSTINNSLVRNRLQEVKRKLQKL